MPRLFLTFDDGPDPLSTPPVLDVLRRQGVQATFFVVAQKAQNERSLMDRILGEGHRIGNHSLDHSYRPFFFRHKKVAAWIGQSNRILTDLSGEQPIGFRPPAGVVTPHVRSALKELNIPLIMWDIRFFDTTFRWTPGRALKSLDHTQDGAIVLLHDRQRESRLAGFLRTLNTYIDEAKQRGYCLAGLTKQDLKPY